MCGPEQVVATVGERAAQADLALVEGVMGCFDGTDGLSEDGSTAQIAKWFGAPVILVLDAGALVRSAAAVDTRSPTAVVSWPPVSGCRCQLAGGTGAPSHVALPLPLRWRPCGLNLGQEPWPRRIERQVLAVPREMAARYSERILAGS
jgi:hypothetical protein